MLYVICILHSLIALTSGSMARRSQCLIMTLKLLGSFLIPPHDQLLIQSSNAMAVLILFVLGLLLFMVALETWKGQKGPEFFC